jgi:septal ring factor EnvC (AmiA/AmiB activator)
LKSPDETDLNLNSLFMLNRSDRLDSNPMAALNFKQKSPSQWALAGGMAMSLLLCSCKEKDALQKEQADLQTALNQAKAELNTYQVKINAVLPNLPAAAATLEVQLKASEKANAELTQAVSEVNSKATRLQDEVKALRPKVEAYKARYLR